MSEFMPENISSLTNLSLEIVDLLSKDPDHPLVKAFAVKKAAELVERFGGERQAVIPLLQAIQEEFRYLPRPILEQIAQTTQITPADLMGVATFYTRFRLKPVGEHRISVCTGTACHVKGASLVLDAFRKELGLVENEDTDRDGRFTVENVACLGCCTLAPVVQIDEKTYGHVQPSSVGEVLEDFLARRDGSAPTGKSLFVPEETLGEIRVGLGSCCQAQGSRQVHDAVVDVLHETQAPMRIKPVGCIGMCHQVPLVEIVSSKGDSTYFAKVRPEEVRSIVLENCRPKSLFARCRYRLRSFLESLWTDEFVSPVKSRRIDTKSAPVCTFLERQVRLATEMSGLCSPIDLDEYVSHGGMAAFRRVLFDLTSDDVLCEMEKAGVRGRGGAGFPTFRKWSFVRDTQSDVKYVVCNGDEGDPGAFMDRMLLESFPYRILEGMMIAARAVGARHGFLYIRAEYPLAVRRVRAAIDVLKNRGFLGEKILGSDFSLSLEVKEGAGAFVCGEETALLESIEGRRGMPRVRPPFPAQAGLFGKPTLINNVETWSLVPWIFRHGGEAFAKAGTPHSPGTKVFALAGKIQRGGLIEVPMGISIRTVVEEIGGSIANGRRFKAVQIGGPSGGCVPAELADTSVDYESLAAVGAIMGSGGMVVLDEDDCMVDIARYFLQFTQEQSCGKCTFCRIGTRRMLEILERICSGKGKKDDLEILSDLAEKVKLGSLCGLGKTAPNPVLSTLRFFNEEYRAHLDGICPAGKCRDLIDYRIADMCNGCSICARVCPVGAIEATPYRQHRIDPAICTRCDACRTACPTGAVEIWSGFRRDVCVKSGF